MRKFMLLPLFFVIIHLNAQNKFKVTLNFDSSIDMTKTSFRYYNGNTEIQLHPDSISNTIIIQDDYYAEKAVLTVYYIPTKTMPFNESFFIDNKPATINFRFDEKKKEKQFYVNSIRNAISIFDKAQNKLYKDFIAFTKKESINMFKLWQLYGDKFGTSDSITTILKDVTTHWNNRAIQFIKSHNQEYFSFWWFKNQIVDQADYCFANDTAYYKKLTKDFLEIFPEKYTKSIAGENLLQKLNRLIIPSQIIVGKSIPVVTDNKNNTNAINEFKEKYLLLHFWATWCVPCKKQLPMIQYIKDNVSPKNLSIVSICTFSDSALMKKNIDLHKMNWQNIYDKNNEIARLFEVSSVPRLILINQNKVIEFIDSENSQESGKRILDIVNGKKRD